MQGITPLFLIFCLHIYFQYNFFISLLLHLFFLILTCSCQYSYNLMLTETYMFRSYILIIHKARNSETFKIVHLPASVTFNAPCFYYSEHRKMRAKKEQHVCKEMNQYMINANRKWILSFGIEWTIGVKYRK